MLEVSLRSRKNEPTGAVLVRPCTCTPWANDPFMCPVHTLKRYMRDTGRLPTGRLFPGNPESLYVSFVRRIRFLGGPQCLNIPHAAEWTSHGFRRGMAQDILDNGGSLAEILRAGGWKSAAFLLYLERTEVDQAAVLDCLFAADVRPSEAALARVPREVRELIQPMPCLDSETGGASQAPALLPVVPVPAPRACPPPVPTPPPFCPPPAPAPPPRERSRRKPRGPVAPRPACPGVRPCPGAQGSAAEGRAQGCAAEGKVCPAEAAEVRPHGAAEAEGGRPRRRRFPGVHAEVLPFAWIPFGSGFLLRISPVAAPMVPPPPLVSGPERSSCQPTPQRTEVWPGVKRRRGWVLSQINLVSTFGASHRFAVGPKPFSGCLAWGKVTVKRRLAPKPSNGSKKGRRSHCFRC